jgi:hypothetical protein
MEYQDIYNAIKAHNGGKFKVTYSTGNVEVKRLFISTCNDICEFAHRSRKKGYIISVYGIVSIEPKLNTDISGVRKCRNNLKNVVKYLTASGFWLPMLNGAKYLLSLSDEELIAMRSWEQYHKVMNAELTEKGIQWFGCDCFSNMFHKPIKTMNFDRYDRHFQKRLIAEKIANRVNCSHRWTNGYDNSYEFRFDEKYIRAWYSEEYRGCANGHYYFLLDGCHAIFGEDD